MKKVVKVTNIINGEEFYGIFYSDEVMNAWIVKQKEKASRGIVWGWGPRTIEKSEPHHTSLVEREYELDGKTVVDLKAEYIIGEPDDQTAEHEAYLAERAQDKIDKASLKSNYLSIKAIVDAMPDGDQKTINLFQLKALKVLIKR